MNLADLERAATRQSNRRQTQRKKKKKDVAEGKKMWRAISDPGGRLSDQDFEETLKPVKPKSATDQFLRSVLGLGRTLGKDLGAATEIISKPYEAAGALGASTGQGFMEILFGKKYAPPPTKILPWSKGTRAHTGDEILSAAGLASLGSINRLSGAIGKPIAYGFSALAAKDLYDTASQEGIGGVAKKPFTSTLAAMPLVVEGAGIRQRNKAVVASEASKRRALMEEAATTMAQADKQAEQARFVDAIMQANQTNQLALPASTRARPMGVLDDVIARRATQEEIGSYLLDRLALPAHTRATPLPASNYNVKQRKAFPGRTLATPGGAVGSQPIPSELLPEAGTELLGVPPVRSSTRGRAAPLTDIPVEALIPKTKVGVERLVKLLSGRADVVESPRPQPKTVSEPLTSKQMLERQSSTPLPPGQRKLAELLGGKTTKAQRVAADGGATAKGEAPPLENFDAKQYVREQVQLQAKARKKDSLISVLGNTKSKLKKEIVDIYAPIEDAVRVAQEKGNYQILPDRDIRYQIDRVLRKETLAEQFVKDSGFDKVIQRTPNLQELDQYLIAKQAIHRSGQGVETGRDIGKDKALVSALRDKYEADSQEVYAYSRKLLEYVTDAGLIPKSLRNKLIKENPEYVPIERIMDELNGVTPPTKGGGVASLSSQSVVQRIKGSKREIESPLNSLLNRTNLAFKQGEINKAGGMLASYRDLPGFLMRELGRRETVGLKHTFSYLDRGTKRTFETTPEIAAAAKNLDAQTLGLLGKIFRAPVRVAKLGITGIRPAFAATNLARDQVTQIINSNRALATSPAHPGNFIKSLFSALSQDKLYDEVVRNAGMQTSFDVFRDAPEISLAKIRAGKSAKSKILYTVTRPGELLRAVENTIGKTEELTRIQAYQGTKNSLIKEGRTAADASILGAEAARTNTVNFARHGAYGRVLNSALLYVNPAIQGSRTLVRNLKTRPAQTMTKVALTTLTPVALATAWALNDPKRKKAWEDIPEYEKENAIIIIPPNPKKDKNGLWGVLKIPLSQEVARLTNIVRRPLEAANELDPVKFGEMANALLSVVSPIDTSSVSKAASALVPQAIKPPVESLTNTNLFTERKIVPEFMGSLPREKQVNDYTTTTAKKIGGALDASPLKVENFIRGAFGGLGSEALHYGDVAMNKAGLISDKEVKGIGSGEATLNRFTKAVGGERDRRISATIKKLREDKRVENQKLYQLLNLGGKPDLSNMSNQRKASIYRQAKVQKAKKALTNTQRMLFDASKEEQKKLLKKYPQLAKDIEIVNQIKSSHLRKSNWTY